MTCIRPACNRLSDCSAGELSCSFSYIKMSEQDDCTILAKNKHNALLTEKDVSAC